MSHHLQYIYKVFQTRPKLVDEIDDVSLCFTISNAYT